MILRVNIKYKGLDYTMTNVTNNTFGILVVIGDKTKIQKKKHVFISSKTSRSTAFHDFYATEICNANNKQFFEVILFGVKEQS